MSRNGTSIIDDFTYYLRIISTTLATEWKLHGVSTYLPNPEMLYSEHVWNAHSATPTFNLKPRTSSGKKYILVSQNDSQECFQRLRNTQEDTADCPKVLPVTQTKSLAFPSVL